MQKPIRRMFCAGLLTMATLSGVAPTVSLAGDGTAHPAVKRAESVSRVPLTPETSAVFARLGAEALDNPAAGRVPNYLRALATTHPGAVVPFAICLRRSSLAARSRPKSRPRWGLGLPAVVAVTISPRT